MPAELESFGEWILQHDSGGRGRSRAEIESALWSALSVLPCAAKAKGSLGKWLGFVLLGLFWLLGVQCWALGTPFFRLLCAVSLHLVKFFSVGL